MAISFVVFMVAVAVAIVVAKRQGWQAPAIGRQTAPVAKESDDAADRRRGRRLSGNYNLLYDYLEHRYADTVVLTFAQMEDLVGFGLPDEARTDSQWWTLANADSDSPIHSNAWILSRRVAAPNLSARTVAFERTS